MERAFGEVDNPRSRPAGLDDAVALVELVVEEQELLVVRVERIQLWCV
jgi:hypothetical protein